MLLQCCTCSFNSCLLSSQNNYFSAFSHPKPKTHLTKTYNYNLNPGRFKIPDRASYKFTCVIKVGFEDIAEIVHNKVLISAGVSAAIGQLSKPFTGFLLYGKHFDLKAVIQAGGFPSTHSSSVVAAATCLALERGFSDSFFGLTLVYAGLVMYDAQGVRREVGIHAKALNEVVSKAKVSAKVPKNIDNVIDCERGEGTSSKLNMKSLGPLLEEETNPLLVRRNKKSRQTKQIVISSASVDDDEERLERSSDNPAFFKESIGHTEVEVVAGALLGFFVSLVVSATA